MKTGHSAAVVFIAIDAGCRTAIWGYRMRRVLLVLLVLGVLAGCFYLGSTETPYQNESFLEMQNLPSLERMDHEEVCVEVRILMHTDH